MIAALLQGAADIVRVAGDEMSTINQIGNWSLATGAMVALGFVAKAWRDSTKDAAAAAKDAAAAAALAAKEAADRIEKQNRECNDRNDKTVAVVDSIAERFSESQTLSAKMLADTVTQLRSDEARRQEQFLALTREQSERHERREERLEQVLKELKVG
jgi:uncharacterized membrane-anchored protein YhcB (DUF1043 family)